MGQCDDWKGLEKVTAEFLVELNSWVTYPTCREWDSKYVEDAKTLQAAILSEAERRGWAECWWEE